MVPSHSSTISSFPFYFTFSGHFSYSLRRRYVFVHAVGYGLDVIKVGFYMTLFPNFDLLLSISMSNLLACLLIGESSFMPNNVATTSYEISKVFPVIILLRA